jgi:hypothetical protein
MMDPRSRPLPEPLPDLPVETPLDALALSEPRADGRAGGAPDAAASRPEEGPAEELVDPEKLLLASEHLQPPKPATTSAKASETRRREGEETSETRRREVRVPQETPGKPPGSPLRTAAASGPPSASAASVPSVTATPTAPPKAARPVAATIVAPTPSTPTPAATSAPAAPPAADSAPPPAPRGPELMDRDFIARNQVVERYLSGRLPIKGATDFERFCRDHPELLDELGIPERVNAALRLLEASGKPEPWAEPPKPFWQKLEIVLGLLGATLVLAIALAIVASGSAQKTRHIAALRQEATERPLDPATSTRDIRLLPSRDGASDAPAIIIGGGSDAQLADFRIDESRSPYRLFRITIDRINQGRVGIIDHLAKDSDGNLRIALNSTALGPGDYQLTIEGLTWQGLPQPDSWVTIGVRATQ